MNSLNLSKKAIYIMIKEMIDVKSQQITKVVNIYKCIYKSAYLDYMKYGYIQSNKNYRSS